MPAQRTITQAEYIALTDLMVTAIDVLLAAKGGEDTGGTAAAAAAAARNWITALDDPDEADITVDLLPSAMALVSAIERESEVASYFIGFNSAVLSHLGQNLNTWLAAGALRVKPTWRRAGNTTISPVNVFPPVTVMGTVATTGAAACTLTKDPITLGLISTALYADAQLEVEVLDGPWGASSTTFTIVGTDFSGAAQSHTAEIPGESITGTKVDVGTASDLFASVTAVTCAGGQAGDDIRIQSKVDR